MAHIKVSAANLQIEFEGSEEFIAAQLLDLVDRLLELTERIPSPHVGSAATSDRPSQGVPEISTNTIAQTVGVKTGSELALAAIAKINLVKERPTASRQDILDEMKGATTYFKDSYASNLSSYLDTLVKSKRINLVARHTFALAAHERARLQDILGFEH